MRSHVGLFAIPSFNSCYFNGAGYYSFFIYGYNVIQCPMEIIHGRQSSLHNVAAGGLIGYLGVTRGNMGVPFVSPYFLYGTRYPGLIGAAVVRSRNDVEMICV
jgi:hypothetical protein